jgi:hypothetical protein
VTVYGGRLQFTQGGHGVIKKSVVRIVIRPSFVVCFISGNAERASVVTQVQRC